MKSRTVFIIAAALALMAAGCPGTRQSAAPASGSRPATAATPKPAASSQPATPSQPATKGDSPIFVDHASTVPAKIGTVPPGGAAKDASAGALFKLPSGPSFGEASSSPATQTPTATAKKASPPAAAAPAAKPAYTLPAKGPAVPPPGPPAEPGRPLSELALARITPNPAISQQHNPLREGGALVPLTPIEAGPTPTPVGPVPVPAAPAPAASPPAAPAVGSDKEPFDPIAVNGPYFVGWEKPKLALVISGRLEGYFEPCGCAGLDRMNGGLARRDSFVKSLHQQGWPLVLVDVGGLAKGTQPQATRKFQIMLDGFKKMGVEGAHRTGYDAIGLGVPELALDASLLLMETPGPFVSANAAPESIDHYRIIERAGKKVLITGVLGKSYQKEVRTPGAVMDDPELKIAEVLAEVKKKNLQPDYCILLAYASMDESKTLAGKFPEFYFVVTAGGQPTPPKTLDPIAGIKPLLVEVGEKGMTVIVIGLYDNPRQPWLYQRVTLDSRFKGSPAMRELMKAYQEMLKSGDSVDYDGLALRPIPYPNKQLLGEFAGSRACKDCHEESYRIWKKSVDADTGHSKAFATLLKKTDPPRNFDPECLCCHVTGWHSQLSVPYQGGYYSEAKTPHLENVGCETCHGPGGNHVKAENGDTAALKVLLKTDDGGVKKLLKEALHVTKEEADKNQNSPTYCRSCHDGDNSPAFDFKKYWPKVEHYE